MADDSNTARLSKLLGELRDASLSKRQKGDLFENLTLAYLRNEPFYRAEYPEVWRYADWAGAQGLSQKDLGIDLVASIAGGDGFCAIQCKFHQEDRYLRKEDIDSFLAQSGKKSFSHRILVTTGALGPNAASELDGQKVPCSIIDRFSLSNSVLDWGRFSLEAGQGPVRAKKALRPHQERALADILRGLEGHDRGMALMACGSGKTLLSLRAAERTVGAGGLALYLVPSLALLSQVLTEWTQESLVPLHSFAVCSDADVGRLPGGQADDYSIRLHELQYPATTKAASLARAVKARRDKDHLCVVFSTYHSIDVLSKAQALGVPEFDLALCDEAHRTTGATAKGEEDESAFVRIHDNSRVRARKRLYMTATPRIYKVDERAGRKSESDTAILYSMDDQAMFGPVFHSLPFTEAVREGILVDYKVLILSVDERLINRKVADLLSSPDNSLVVGDAAKIVGCFKAMAKHGLGKDLPDADPRPMRRAVAFCQVIEPRVGGTRKGSAGHKVSSKLVADMFAKVVEDYLRNSDEPQGLKDIKCELMHVDGSMNATEKSERLNWLREDFPENTCRVLTNVRCLSEGVDLPSLDGVLFLAPRKSMVEVVQSVGRVMRKAPGKDFGYVVLPVVIPANVEPHVALDNNKVYGVIWQVLQALRSHDNSFDSLINKLKFMDDTQGKIDIVTLFDDSRTAKGQSQGNGGEDSVHDLGIGKEEATGPAKSYLFGFDEDVFNKAIVAKLVKKVGNPDYLGQWAEDVIRIAQTYIDRIKAILEDPKNKREIEVFKNFAEEIKDDLNESLTDDEIIEMLAQHMITGPAFEAVFENNSFLKQNPVSISLEKVLEVFKSHYLEKEAQGLGGFYESVRKEVENMQNKVSGIDNTLGRQKIIIELYDKFFSKAFPKMAQRLGIVYTPIEIVDFIINSVNDLLKIHFGQTLGDKNINIIDPFVGTGSFITRLIQSGLIAKDDLPYKYKHEIHANEIMILPYYIASINIESAYNSIIGGDYEQFPGICLTDTFQLYEKDDLISNFLEDNSKRRTKQKALPLRIIFGNPPYAVGQKSANDNNKQIRYPLLDSRISITYVQCSNANNLKGVYDSYVRAFRWASDRLANNADGIVAFITNSGYIHKTAMDGFRKSLAKEFQHIYIVNLRGDVRKDMLAGEDKEGENIFGHKSMTGIAITFLVKKSNNSDESKILYYDIGSSLTRDEKFQIIKSFGTISSIKEQGKFHEIHTDSKGKWIDHGVDSFSSHIIIGNKKEINNFKIFKNYSIGFQTARDAWCYNFSSTNLTKNINKSIDFFNLERHRFHNAYPNIDMKKAIIIIDKFINNDGTKFSWTVNIKHDLINNKNLHFKENSLVKSLYRPFTKMWLYFNHDLNERVGQIPQLFPDNSVNNMALCVTGIGARCGFSLLITNTVPNYHLLDTGQCFPFYLYEDTQHDKGGLLQNYDTECRYTKSNAITKEALAHFKDAYPSLQIDRKELFFYIYGILHSTDYREVYSNNLKDELPRIPKVKSSEDFLAFANAGKQLAKLHLYYEDVPKFPLEIVSSENLTDDDYYVTQMKFRKSGTVKDRSTIIYNSKITLKGIPLRAYDYIVSGKPAIAWVMKYQAVRTDPKSGIVNDANLWATETMKNPKYPLELLQRVITVSLETLKIMEALPRLVLT